MTQVKIEQNPPIEVKDKKINEDPPQVEIKLKDFNLSLRKDEADALEIEVTQ